MDEINKRMKAVEDGEVTGEERQEEIARLEQELNNLGDSGDPKPWWYWFRIDVPPKTSRFEFILIVLVIIVLEMTFGPITGIILRSIFGWPF
jgi:hypothetical protein